MKLFSKGRRGQVTRHPEPPPEPTATPAAPTAAPSPPAQPDPTVYELTGVRRSVFDLLKEKYPDLAPGAKTPAAPVKSAPPAPPPAPAPPPVAVVKPAPVAKPVARVEPPKVEAALPAKEPEPPKAAPLPPPVEKPIAIEALKVEPPPEPEPIEFEPIEPILASPALRNEEASETLALPARKDEPREPESPAVAPMPAGIAVIPSPLPPTGSAGVPPALEIEDASETLALPARKDEPPTLPVKAKTPWRYRGPSRQVVFFWGGAALLFGLGTYVLASLRPDRTPSPQVATLPRDSGGEAQSVSGLSLEPEKVIVPVPGTKPTAEAKTPPPKAEAKKPEPPKPEPKKPEPKKPAPPKKETPADSSIVIEQVPPVLPPLRTGGSQPEYPLEARSAGIEGTVVLFALIDRNGKVKNPRVVKSLSPPLDAAALAAFRTWRFKPATQKGKKVEFKYSAGIEFRINSPVEQVAAAPEPEATPTVAPAAAPGGPALLPYGGDFTPPVRITMVWPQKPQSAQMVKGEVKLQLAVSADGNVRDVEVLEGLPQGVTEAAIEAVRQWKFKPARRSGEPVAVYHRVSLRF